MHWRCYQSHCSDTVPKISTLLKGCLIELVMCAPHVGVLVELMVLQIPQVTEHDSARRTDVAAGTYPLPTQLQ
jgi:hypothetical protein